MKATTALRGSLFTLGVIVAGVTLGPMVFQDQDGPTKVTFVAQWGDGAHWAGDADVIYEVGGDARTIHVDALPVADKRKNSTQITKTVPRKTAVSMRVHPGYRVPSQCMIRAIGVSSRIVRGGPGQSPACSGVVG